MLSEGERSLARSLARVRTHEHEGPMCDQSYLGRKARLSFAAERGLFSAYLSVRGTRCIAGNVERKRPRDHRDATNSHLDERARERERCATIYYALSRPLRLREIILEPTPSRRPDALPSWRLVSRDISKANSYLNIVPYLRMRLHVLHLSFN